MSEAMELEGVTKTYLVGQPGEVAVLQGVDLVLRPGEITALVAPSGAGKSTLLHIAGLLDVADTGTVTVGGKAVAGLSEKQRTAARRSEVGFVYQFHHLLPEFSAAENIILPQLANGVARSAAEARAATLLEQMQVGPRASHRPATLSGGEQQRVAIARALANSPAVLLADEPTGNLDPATSDVVFGQLLALARGEGLAALIATHNLALADRMDRVVRLEHGRLTEG